MLMTKKIVKRFLTKFKKTKNCWIWEGTMISNGYGHFCVYHEHPVLAHRYSWTLFNGKIPKNKYVLHKCNNPKCVNPSHLYIGTQKDNIRDVINNGKFIYGSKHPISKLTEIDIPKIIEFSSQGISQRKIASMFKINQTTIWKIIHGLAWPHVKRHRIP